MKPLPIPENLQPKEKLLASQAAQNSYWDAGSQCLWVDFRKLRPELEVQAVMSWDAMMMSHLPIPHYPSVLNPLAWPNIKAVADWKKQIPAWIQESCLLFPTGQMRLLHFCGRYPQMIELLDHSPMLAWRLIESDLSETEIVTLLSDKRTTQVKKLGWQGKPETVQFLRNLRLRQVNADIAEQIDVCLLDDARLDALQALPRINSMALSLAARFPEMIGCRLHQALAAMPCRPMQCRSMVALLEDAYALAKSLALPPAQVQKIADARYLVEVETLYRTWLQQGLAKFDNNALNLPGLVNLAQDNDPYELTEEADWLTISQRQQHAWWLHWEAFKNAEISLYIFSRSALEVAFLVDKNTHEILKVRQTGNQLPSAEHLSVIHLWQASLV